MAEAAQYPTTPDSFDKQYIRLRSVLDALHTNAIRYCLEYTDAESRTERAMEIESILKPALQLTGGEPSPEGVCAEGYNNCGGVCVPYRCPELQEN